MNPVLIAKLSDEWLRSVIKTAYSLSDQIRKLTLLRNKCIIMPWINLYH